MKKQFVSSIIVFLASAAALADGPVTIGDRWIPSPEEAPDVIGITHTENFEYACPVTVYEGKTPEGVEKSFKTTAYIDTDFSEGTGYRFALGFYENRGVGPMVAAEAKVVKVTKARCPGLCLSMELQSPEGGKMNVTTHENMVTKEISLVAIDASTQEVELKGTCHANEPE